MDHNVIKVIFVCHGNIHRSPMAQGIFQKLINDNNLQDKIFCDSAGTVCNHWDIPPHFKTLEILDNHGIKLEHKSRLFKSNDLTNFDYVLAMDKFNLKDILFLKRVIKHKKENIFLMRYFDPDNLNIDVPDPHLGIAGFKDVYEILLHSVNSFFDFIKKENYL